MSDNDKHESWLARKETIRLLSIVGLIILVITVALQSVIKIKGHFTFDAWFAFGALFGFACCVVMVLFAKGLGRFLKRDENYYDG